MSPLIFAGRETAGLTTFIFEVATSGHSAVRGLSIHGMTRLRQWNLRSAGDAFAAARRLEPANATAHHWSALYYNVTGDTAKARFSIATTFETAIAARRGQ